MNLDLGSPIAGQSRPPSLGLVIVNFGSHQLIRDNYGWIAGTDGVTVLVVDNFKSGPDRDAIRHTVDALGFTLVSLDDNRGYGTAANAGLTAGQQLGLEVMMVANPDLSIDEPTLKRIARECRSRPGTLISPLVVDEGGRHWGGLGSVDMVTGRLWTRDDREGPRWISGACVAAHQSAWSTLGGFDDAYFMYWEDVDLSLRAASEVDGVDVLRTAEVRHAVGGTQSSAEGKSPLYVWHNCRGRLVFAGKHLGPLGRVRWVLHTPADIRRVLSRGGQPTSVRKVQLLGPALAGCLSALPWLVAPKIIQLAADRRRSISSTAADQSSVSESSSPGDR